MVNFPLQFILLMIFLPLLKLPLSFFRFIERNDVRKKTAGNFLADVIGDGGQAIFVVIIYDSFQLF